MKKFFLICLALLAYVIGKSQNLQFENDSNRFRNGPYSAWVTSLEIAPSNPDVIYIGTYAMGIYKTINGGGLWTHCSTENLPVWEDTLLNSPGIPCWWNGDYYPIYDIAVDPQDAEHVWIGTSKTGLLESTDGGDSWQQLIDDFPVVHGISINPDNNQNIWGVVYTCYQDWFLSFSNDGGQNWTFYEGFKYPDKWVLSMYADADFNLYIERETDESGDLYSILKSTDNGNS